MSGKVSDCPLSVASLRVARAALQVTMSSLLTRRAAKGSAGQGRTRGKGLNPLFGQGWLGTFNLGSPALTRPHGAFCSVTVKVPEERLLARMYWHEAGNVYRRPSKVVKWMSPVTEHSAGRVESREGH